MDLAINMNELGKETRVELIYATDHSIDVTVEFEVRTHGDRKLATALKIKTRHLYRLISILAYSGQIEFPAFRRRAVTTKDVESICMGIPIPRNQVAGTYHIEFLSEKYVFESKIKEFMPSFSQKPLFTFKSSSE